MDKELKEKDESDRCSFAFCFDVAKACVGALSMLGDHDNRR